MTFNSINTWLFYIVSLTGAALCVALWFRQNNYRSRCDLEFYLADKHIGAWELGMGLAAVQFSVACLTTFIASIYMDRRLPWYILVELGVSVTVAYVVGSRMRARTDREVDFTPITWLARVYQSEILIPTAFALCILFVTPSIAFIYIKTAEIMTKDLSFKMNYANFVMIIIILTTMIAISGLKGMIKFQVYTMTTTIILMVFFTLMTVLIKRDDRVDFSITPSSTIDAASSTYLSETTATLTISSIIISCVTMMRFPILIRYQTSTSTRSVKRGAILFAVISIVGVVLPTYLIANFAAVYFPPRIDEQWNILPNPIFGSSLDDFCRIIPVASRIVGAKILGRFGSLFSDVFIISLAATSLAAAISYLHLFGSIFSNDIYKRIIRRDCGLSESVFVGRSTMLVVGIALSLILLIEKKFSSTIRLSTLFTETAMTSGSIAVQTIPALIDRLYLKRGSKYGVVLGFLIGVLIVVMTSDFAIAVLNKLTPSLLNHSIYHFIHNNSLLFSISINLCMLLIFSGSIWKRRQDTKS